MHIFRITIYNLKGYWRSLYNILHLFVIIHNSIRSAHVVVVVVVFVIPDGMVTFFIPLTISKSVLRLYIPYNQLILLRVKTFLRKWDTRAINKSQINRPLYTDQPSDVSTIYKLIHRSTMNFQPIVIQKHDLSNRSLLIVHTKRTASCILPSFYKCTSIVKY